MNTDGSIGAECPRLCNDMQQFATADGGPSTAQIDDLIGPFGVWFFPVRMDRHGLLRVKVFELGNFILSDFSGLGLQVWRRK